MSLVQIGIVLFARLPIVRSRLKTLATDSIASLTEIVMAVKSTIYKVDLEISDIDRNYYATHNLTLAQHPSETDRRLMARVIAFSLLAHERLEFGRGLSNDEDPALWRRDDTGIIEQWIELGQPEESSIRKACGRAQQVIIFTYSGNSAGVWWSKNEISLSRSKNLTVIDLSADAIDAATRLIQRTMKLQGMIQEGECQLISDSDAVAFRPLIRMSSAR
jgi:uncharacterized protein YaeQ